MEFGRLARNLFAILNSFPGQFMSMLLIRSHCTNSNEYIYFECPEPCQCRCNALLYIIYRVPGESPPSPSLLSSFCFQSVALHYQHLPWLLLPTRSLTNNSGKRLDNAIQPSSYKRALTLQNKYLMGILLCYYMRLFSTRRPYVI